MIKVALAAIALAAVSTTALAQTGQTPPPAPTSTPAPSTAALPTINSPIKDLLANPATAAVVEKHLPGVSQHPALPQFQDMTFGQVAPFSGGAITQATIDAIDTDLKALPQP